MAVCYGKVFCYFKMQYGRRHNATAYVLRVHNNLIFFKLLFYIKNLPRKGLRVSVIPFLEHHVCKNTSPKQSKRHFNRIRSSVPYTSKYLYVCRHT